MAKVKEEIPETASFFARRTESVDAEGIAKLVQRRTEAVFGRVNVEYIIERATLGITLVGNEDGGEILAHASLLDYPVVGSGVEQCSWEAWTSQYFTSDIRASPMNTLFLHLFVAKEGFQQAAITEILRIAFVAVPLLQYIIITVPSSTSLGPVLQLHFTAWSLTDGLSSSPHHLAHVAHRHHHFPQLHVRPARVEDADDLMAVFKEYATEMAKQYGDYFLAELIESQDDYHKTIVAEVAGRAVGFISVTSAVDLTVLNQNFQLEPYHHLRHPAPTSQDSSELKSQSVLSVPGSDQLHTSSVNVVEGEGNQQPNDTADDNQQRQQAGEGQGSQSKLSSSSLTRLAQIAQMTSSKSRLSNQSRSKLATHSKTKVSGSKTKLPATSSQIQTKPGPPDTKSVQSRTTVVEPESKKGVASKLAISKSKTSTSKMAITDSKAGASSSQAEQSSVIADQSVEITASSGSVVEVQPVEGSVSEEEVMRKEKEKKLAGHPNVLAIQLFAIQDQFEMRSLDLLVTVFQSFPDHDFCVLSLPHSISQFPLLLHFTRVPQRVHSTLDNELLILHKCSLLHSFAVRAATTSDLPAVRDLVEGLEGREEVMSDVVRSVEGGRDTLADGATPLSAIVAECANQIVGVAIVRREEDLLYLRSHYNIEDYVYMNHHRPDEHGRLHHFLLSPAFSPLSKHFIKEVLRKCHMTCLYYPYHHSLLSSSSSSSHPHKSHTITTALADMVPVRDLSNRPRRQVSYPDRERLGINQPLPPVLDNSQEPFALYHINRKLTLEPKLVINSRVVLVGASDTAISLLESLIFNPHLSFSNLTLISPCGVPSSSLPSYCCYPPGSLSLLGLSVWVHIVTASLTAINREDKEIVVMRKQQGEEAEERGEEGEGVEEGVVPYDHLILCTGLQFTPPPHISSDNGDVPVFYDHNDGLEVSEWVQKHLQLNDQVVVYGSTVEAYTAVQSLLANGVDPALITFIRPHPPHFLQHNGTLEERVQSSLEQAGVKLIEDGVLVEVVDGGIRLRGDGEGERIDFIECQGVICMEEKKVSRQIFSAVNDACLVYDNGLVIDTNHSTNDTAILAAGPLTKFSRLYHSNQWSHANFNSREVGQKLATTLLSELDPNTSPEPLSSDDDLIPSYTQPKAVYTILPGGLHYLHVQKPTSSLTEQTTMGEECVTDTENGYFRIHINQYSQVQTITILSHKGFEVFNYLALYGVHEKYLNNVISRYSEGLISDLFIYLREPWSCAVFHDRFPDLREEVGELLSQQIPVADGVEGQSVEGQSVEERVRVLLNEQQTVSLDDQKEKLMSEFITSPIKPAVQQLLHRYLHYNHHHLTMYANPDIF